jgi:hypothetical protein
MSPVIPTRVVELLRGPSVMHAGTRDAALRPAHSQVTGAIFHDDRETVTFFVSESQARRIASNLEQNGRVALTIAQTSHEAYQLKGAYVSSRPTADSDYALQDSYRTEMISALTKFWPEEMVKPMILGHAYRPGVAITFRVEEIFQQTPGPGAGDKLE